MATYSTKQVFKEIADILSNDSYYDKVELDVMKSESQETADVALYVTAANVVMKPAVQKSTPDAYTRTAFVHVFANVDCQDDKTKIYDVGDRIEKDILTDSKFWQVIQTREVVSVEYDGGAYYPRRLLTVLIEVTYRLACDN